MPPATASATDDHHDEDVELASMAGMASHSQTPDDDESLGSAESEFSNDEGEANEYKPGAVGRAGLRVMDQDLKEHRRRKNTFCLALVMLALGIAMLKVINGGNGPSSPIKGMPQPTSDTEAVWPPSLEHMPRAGHASLTRHQQRPKGAPMPKPKAR